VVDRIGQRVEEPLERRRIVGVEGGDGPRVDSQRGAVEALRVTAGDHDLRPLRPRAPGGLQPDPGAPADHDYELADQLRLAG
jgi:hypothetical protein